MTALARVAMRVGSGLPWQAGTPAVSTARVDPRLEPLRRVLEARAGRLAGAGLLVAVGGLVLSLLLWAGQRFAAPPVSFFSGSVTMAVHWPTALAYALVGALLAARRPRNPIGWLFLVIGIAMSFVPAVHELVARAGADFAAPARSVAVAAWVSSSFHLPVTGALVIWVFLQFPDGRLEAGCCRIAGWLAGVGAILIGSGLALDPAGLAWYPTLPNPFAAPRDLLPLVTGLKLVGLAAMLLALGLSVVTLIRRFRRYSVAERRALTWIGLAMGLLAASGGALLVVRYAAPVDARMGEPVLVATLVSAGLLPVAAAIGILRDHLFELDVILDRALVYVPLTGFLGGLYAASVTLFQRIFIALTGDTSDVAIVLTTLVLAGSFTPVRRVLEGFVDRHFKPAPDRAPAGPAAPSAMGVAPETVVPAELAATLRAIERRLARLEQGGDGADPASGMEVAS